MKIKILSIFFFSLCLLLTTNINCFSQPVVTDSNLNRTKAEELFNLGKQQVEQQKYEEAVKSYTECVRIHPQASGCYYNRAEIYKTRNITIWQLWITPKSSK